MFSAASTTTTSILLFTLLTKAAPTPDIPSKIQAIVSQPIAITEEAWLALPTVDDIKKKVGVKPVSGPVEVFNIPGYANWTSNGWNVRLHGTAYKPLPLSDSKVDDLGAFLMPGYPQRKWTPEITANVQNMTKSLFSLPQSHQTLSFDIEHDGDLITNFTLPQPTDELGEYDVWVNVNSDELDDGDDTEEIQTLDIYTTSSSIGNATAYLVPEEGLYMVSDVDDVLRVTEYWLPRRELVNSIGLDYKPWMNMPEVIDGIAQANPDMAFHYVTTTPQPGARRYIDYVLQYYPPGSFDFRPMNLTTLTQIMKTRRENLIRLMETFPQRKFILLGDISNSDIMSSYPEMTRLFPGQVQCILLRNVSATEPLFALPVDYSGFQGLLPTQVQFFRTPDDIAGIDFANGGCRNYTVPQTIPSGTVLPSLSQVKNAILEGNTPFGALKAAWSNLPSIF